MFALFEQPLFRCTDNDAAPVMVVQMGDREASMPLRSIQRELGIADDSPDGRMLALIGEALDFVPALHLGDKLPQEVLTGDASWQPGAEHVHRALTRLNLQLVAWMRGTAGSEPIVLDADALARADADPSLRQTVQEAFQRAAAFLKLPSKESVIAQLEVLASELSYIEALRDRFLDRVRALAARIERLVRAASSDIGQRGSLDRLRFLSAVALAQLNRRFDEQDAQVAEVMAVLRNLDSHRGFIRSNRDWLYRSHMAWEPLLAEWEKSGGLSPDALRPLLARTYQFLAPRFMPVTEWLKGAKAPKPSDRGGRSMVW